MRSTFEKIGVPLQDLEALVIRFLRDLNRGIIARNISMAQLEESLNQLLKEPLSNKKSVIQLLDQALEHRARTIFTQVKEDILGSGGKTLDFGAGDGQVTQLLKQAGADIEGFDVAGYQASNVDRGLVAQFDGDSVPRDDEHYDTILVTNVFHHELNNQKCLDECYRLLKPGGTMVVIETVPQRDTPEEWDRTYWNDWFYNRPFHPGVPIPVPGTYETPQGWIDRFKKIGLEMTSHEDQGVDIPVIQDRHYRFVLKKPETANSQVDKVLK